VKEIIPKDDSGVDENVLRTGMISYWSRVDEYLTVPMKWGTISDSKVDDLWAGGGTNSYAGMYMRKRCKACLTASVKTLSKKQSASELRAGMYSQ